MSYFERLFDLMVEVMLPLSLLVAAGGVWPIVFKDVPLAHTRTQLNRLVMYLFYPSIMFAVAATTPITGNLLSVPLLVGDPMAEAQYAAVLEGATPAMVTTLLRFRLDHDAAALLIGWSTILFWLTLPLALAAGLVG